MVIFMEKKKKKKKKLKISIDLPFMQNRKYSKIKNLFIYYTIHKMRTAHIYVHRSSVHHKNCTLCFLSVVNIYLEKT